MELVFRKYIFQLFYVLDMSGDCFSNKLFILKHFMYISCLLPALANDNRKIICLLFVFLYILFSRIQIFIYEYLSGLCARRFILFDIKMYMLDLLFSTFCFEDSLGKIFELAAVRLFFYGRS